MCFVFGHGGADLNLRDTLERSNDVPSVSRTKSHSVPLSAKSAEDWFFKSASQGLERTQFLLGVFL
jgi:hypothetical protein